MWPTIVFVFIISLTQTSLAVTLEDVRAAIATRKSEWVAEKTSFSDLPEDQIKARLGTRSEEHTSELQSQR